MINNKGMLWLSNQTVFGNIRKKMRNNYNILAIIVVVATMKFKDYVFSVLNLKISFFNFNKYMI